MKSLHQRKEGETHNPDPTEQAALPEAGRLICDQCANTVDTTPFAPLSLEKCPGCGNLLFIPMEIRDWWAIRPLGAGGFGSVYLGRTKTPPHSTIVIKILRAESTQPAQKAAFKRECEFGYSLARHPNLVEIRAYGKSNGMRFMTMKYVDGIPFKDYAKEQRAPLPPEECLYYILDIVEALDYLRENNHLHRDVQPGNIIIRPDGRATLIDLGSCMPLEEACIPPADKTITGSPYFISPERYMRAGEDVRSDIYSLGLVLYYGLKGETYTSAESLAHVIRAQVRRLRMPLKTKLPGVDAPLLEVLERMIAWDREERFASYDEVREHVVSLLCSYQQAAAADDVIARLRHRFSETYRVLP